MAARFLRGARLLSSTTTSASAKYVRLPSLPDRYIDECVRQPLMRAGCANVHLLGTWHISNGVEDRMRACINRLPKLSRICAESKISPGESREMKKIGKLARQAQHSSAKVMRQRGHDEMTVANLLLYGEIDGADFRAATQLAKTAGTWPTLAVRVMNIDQYKRLLAPDVVKIINAQWIEAREEDTYIWLDALEAMHPDLYNQFSELRVQKEAEVKRLNQTFSEPFGEAVIHSEAFRTAVAWMNKNNAEFEAVRYQASAQSSEKNTVRYYP